MSKPEILTVKLRNGRTVLAHKSNGETLPVAIKNFNEAQERAMKLGAGWAVTGIRPYHIAMIDSPTESRPLREGEEIGYKTGWYKKPTDYTNR